MMFTHTAQRHLYVKIRHYSSDNSSCRGHLSSSSCWCSKRGPGCRASAATISEQAKEEIQQVRQPGAFPQQAILPQQEAGSQLLTWEQVGQQAGEDVLQGYQLLPERAVGPRAAPSRVLPTDRDARTDKAVLLYRDTDGWCPFCERVWLALEEKGIPYDTMFINLRKKPDWFKDVVPTNKVPAVSIHGQMVWESDAILEAIEEAFPDPPLWPSDPAKKAETQEAASAAQQLLDAGYRYLRMSSPSSSAQNGAAQGNGAAQEYADGRQEFEGQLQQLEDRLAQQDGPFIAGQFSIADCLYVSGLERFAANMPAFQGLHLRGNPQFPHLDAWFAAMDAKPAYQRVKSDPLTLNMVYGKLFGAQRVRAQPASEAARRARREVAAKLHKNHDVVLADIVHRSGIWQPAVTAVGVNGYPAEPKPSMVSAVDFTLRRLASYLLHGDPGPKPDCAESKAFGAACLAFFRNRASSPRDLSAAACDELRDACDAILRETY